MLLQKLAMYLSTAGLFCSMITLNLVLWVLNIVAPALAKKIALKMGEKVTMTQNPLFRYEDWGLTFASAAFVKTASRHMWLSLGQEAFVGLAAPDSPVVTMQRRSSSIGHFVSGASGADPPHLAAVRAAVRAAHAVVVCRKQAAGAQLRELHLTPVYVQTGGVQAARQGLQRRRRLPGGLRRRGACNRSAAPPGPQGLQVPLSAKRVLSEGPAGIGMNNTINFLLRSQGTSRTS